MYISGICLFDIIKKYKTLKYKSTNISYKSYLFRVSQLHLGQDLSAKQGSAINSSAVADDCLMFNEDGSSNQT